MTVGAVGGLAADMIDRAVGFQTDAERAIAYLENMLENLKELEGSLQRVHASTKSFSAIGEKDYNSDRQGIQGDLTSIIDQLEDIVELCEKANDDDDEEYKGGGWCTIM